MLAAALDMQIEAGSITELDWQTDTLLEILIKLFTKKLIDALRHGMPRSYAEHADDLPMLRGRLHVSRQFTTLVASPQKLACRYDTLTEDIPLNQVIKAAISRLSRVVRSADTHQRLREAAMMYSEVAPVPIGALSWNKVIIDRTNSRWRELVDLVSNRLQPRPPFRAQLRPSNGLIELPKMGAAGVGRLWISGLPERPFRVRRRQATYPQRTAQA
jgi:5-methylcytosine-specific restriction enzyme subunit McrC